MTFLSIAYYATFTNTINLKQKKREPPLFPLLEVLANLAHKNKYSSRKTREH